MAKLYEISEQLARLITDSFIDETGEETEVKIDSATGEVFDAAALNALAVSRQEKIEAIGRFILNLNSDAAQYGEAEKRFKEKKERTQKRAESLRAYLEMNMEPGEKYHSDVFDVKWTSSKSTYIENQDEIPDEYLKTKTETTVDKRKLLADLKEGKEIPGAALRVNQKLAVR